ncbi:UVT-7 protein, partial [Aphelenchoides avenae]
MPPPPLIMDETRKLLGVSTTPNGISSSRPSASSTPIRRSRWLAKCRLYSVVLSIGAGSMFLVSLDSVVDNLLPVAQPFLLNVCGTQELADIAWEWIVSSRIYGVAVGCFVSLLLSSYSSRKGPLIGALAMNFLGGVMSGLVVYVPFGVFVACLGRFINGVGSGIAQVGDAGSRRTLPGSGFRWSAQRCSPRFRPSSRAAPSWRP